MTFKFLSAHLSAVLVAGAFVGAFPASAQEVRNMVGTWKPVDHMHASVRLGAANDHHPQFDAPDIGEPADAWTVVIEEQKGRAFHGHATSPQGKDEPLVGVISQDGAELIMSGMEAGLQGEFIGDQLEFCYSDHDADRAAVACVVLAKQ